MMIARLWPWVWPLFLFQVIVEFGLFEGYALAYGYETLSHWVWRITAAWPPFGWLLGVITGFLAAHFFWPNQGIKNPPPGSP